MSNHSESHPHPPSSPLLSSFSDEVKRFKHQKYRSFKPSTHSFDYPTPNPSSSIGELPSDDVVSSSPVKQTPVATTLFETPVKKATAPTPEQKQTDELRKRVNFNLDLNKTSIISSNSVTSSPARISKKRRVKIVSPLEAIKPIRIPLDSSVISIGRSGKLNQYPIGASNKSISRIHCQITYLEDEKLVSLRCLGHNGINVTIPSAIDVHKLDDTKRVYLILPRSDDSNEPEHLLEDSDTEDEIFGKPKAAASPRRILSRHQSFTNFCVFKGETFRMPLIEDTILDFKGELIRLRFGEEMIKKSNKEEVITKPVTTATVPKSDESPLRAVNTSTGSMLPSSPIRESSGSDHLIIPPSSPILGFYKDAINSSPVSEEIPINVKESSSSPFVPFSLSVATSKDSNTKPTQIPTTKSQSIQSIDSTERISKLPSLSSVKSVSNLGSLTSTKQASKLPSLNLPKLASLQPSLNSQKPASSLNLSNSACRQQSLNSSKPASKLPSLNSSHPASKQPSLNLSQPASRQSSLQERPFSKPTSRGASIEPPLRSKSRPSSAEPPASRETSVDAINKVILSKMSDNQLNKRPRGRPPKSSYVKTEDQQHLLGENSNSEDQPHQNHYVVHKEPKPKKKDEFAEIQELSEDTLQEVTKKLDNLEEVKRVLINHLAYSRNQQTPFSDLAVLTAIQENKYNRYEVRCVLKTVKCIGVIERTGKDAAGKPLDEQYYYIPEDDEDTERARLVVDLKGSASHLRSCRKTHKQYYWKKPKK